MNKYASILMIFSLLFLSTSSTIPTLSAQTETDPNRDNVIENNLRTLQELLEEEKTDSEKYKKVLDDTQHLLLKTVLDEQKIPGIRRMWQCLRCDEILNKDYLGTGIFTRHIMKVVKEHSPKVERNEYLEAIKWGTFFTMPPNRIAIKTWDKGRGFLLTFNKTDENYQIGRFYHIDQYGTESIYRYDQDQDRFLPIFKRRSITVNEGGKQNVYNLLVPLPIQGTVITTVQMGDTLFATSVDEKFRVKGFEAITYTQNLPREISNLSTPSTFSFRKDDPAPFTENDPVLFFPTLTEESQKQIDSQLVQLGMPEMESKILCYGILKIGQPVIVVGATIFRGTVKEIKKGNYESMGFNQWNNGTKSIYMVVYKKNKLSRVELQDGSIITDFSKNGYNLTWNSPDGTRSYVCNYSPEGVQLVSGLYFNNFGTLFEYDAHGPARKTSITNMLSNPLRAGQNPAGSTPKYRAVEIKPEVYRFRSGASDLELESEPFAIKLTPNNNPINWEYYSILGKRMADFTVNAGQAMTGFPDLRQRVPYHFAKYGQQQPEKLLADRTYTILAGLTETQKDGTLLLKVTESLPHGDIIKTWEKSYPEK
jgi:hypothetical protein